MKKPKGPALRMYAQEAYIPPRCVKYVTLENAESALPPIPTFVQQNQNVTTVLDMVSFQSEIHNHPDNTKMLLEVTLDKPTPGRLLAARRTRLEPPARRSTRKEAVLVPKSTEELKKKDLMTLKLRSREIKRDPQNVKNKNKKLAADANQHLTSFAKKKPRSKYPNAIPMPAQIPDGKTAEDEDNLVVDDDFMKNIPGTSQQSSDATTAKQNLYDEIHNHLIKTNMLPRVMLVKLTPGQILREQGSRAAPPARHPKKKGTVEPPKIIKKGPFWALKLRSRQINKVDIKLNNKQKKNNADANQPSTKRAKEKAISKSPNAIPTPAKSPGSNASRGKDDMVTDKRTPRTKRAKKKPIPKSPNAIPTPAQSPGSNASKGRGDMVYKECVLF